MSYPRTVAEAGIKILRHHDQEYEIPVRHVQWGGVMKRYDEMGRAIFDDEIGVADECCTLAWPSENLQSRTSGFANAWPAVLGGGIGGSGKGGGKKQSQGGGGAAGASFSGVRTNFSNGSPNAGATFGGVRSNFSSGSAQAGGSFTGGTNPKLDPNSANYGFRPNGPANQGNGMNVHMDPQEPGAGGTGGQAPVATPGKAPKSHCGSMSGKHQMLPVLGDGWEPDDRFKGLDVELPKDYPKLPKGVYGIAIAGTHEYEQKSLFFPTETRLFAVNVAGDPGMGSMVYDLDDEFRVDKDRGAPLQSAFRVLKEPIGGANAIAIQLGQSGCTDTEGGYVYDVGQGGEPAGKGTQVEQELPYVIAQLSVNKGGFIDVGSADDKHENGADADGTKINKAHISTKALFRRNKQEDGPIEFNGPYPKCQKLPENIEAHLGWDDATQMWRFWSHGPHKYISDTPSIDHFTIKPNTEFPNVPIKSIPNLPVATTGITSKANPATIKKPTENPPVATPATVSTSTGTVPGSTPFTNPLETGTPAPPGAPFVPTGGIQSFNNEINQLPTTAAIAGQAFMGSNMAFASSQELAQPVGWGAAAASYGKGAMASPITGGMSAFGAQGGEKSPTSCSGGPMYAGAGGDPWVYNQKPGSSRFPTGTASGGWIIHPPETTPADQASYGMVPPNVTMSITYFMTAPGAYFASGTPNLAIGGVTSGWSWGMDATTGDLLWRTHVLGDPTTGIRFILGSQNIAWYSGTSYQGIIDHANTANRTYTFPDVTAPVAMMLTGVGDPNGSVTAPESTLYWDTSANTAYVNNNSGTAWTALAGGGGGGMSGSGTAYKIPKFSAATTLADSSLATDSTNQTWTMAPVVSTSGSPVLFTFTAPAHTTLAAAEAKDVYFNLARTVQFTAGADIDDQRAIYITAPTYSATAAQTITSAATLEISGGPIAGANVNIPGEPWALKVASGATFLNGNLYVGFGSPGDVLFIGGSGRVLWEVAGTFYYDYINNRFGIGTGTPARKIDALDGGGDPQLRLSYDGSTYTEILTDAAGQTYITSAGGTVLYYENSRAGTYNEIATSNTSAAADSFAGFAVYVQSTTGAADPYLQLSINGVTDWIVSVDNSDADKLLIGPSLGSGFVKITTTGLVGVNCTASRRFESLDDTNPQLRLTHTSGSLYVDFTCDSNGELGITPSVPSAWFDVRYLSILSGATDANLLLKSAACASFGLQLQLNNDASPDATLWNYESGSFTFGQNNTERMVFTTAEVALNDPGNDIDFRIEGDSLSHGFFLDASAATENIALLAAAAPNWQSMDRGLFVGDASTAPTGNPASGYFQYSLAGVPKWRDTSGNIFSLVKSSAYTVTNGSTDRTYDANAMSLDEIADVLGTLIADLQATGIIG